MKTLQKLFLVSLILTCSSCNFGADKAEKSEEQLVIGKTYENDSDETNIPVVIIKTQDFMFVDVPDTLSEGYTSFRVENNGVFPHNAGIVKLLNGKGYEQFLEHMEKNDLYEFPEWAVQMGGPTSPLSGEKAQATVPLSPGEYAIICGVPMPGGVPHYMKGMTKKLIVTEGDNSSTQPKPDLRMVLDDYSFDLSSEITSGLKTIEIVNQAEQPHEFLLTRLDEGKTGNDMMNWMGQVMSVEDGPLPEAPGKFLNGVSPLDENKTNFITVDFTPGEYMLICPYPDEQDNKPHFMHGMTRQFTVPAP